MDPTWQITGIGMAYVIAGMIGLWVLVYLMTWLLPRSTFLEPAEEEEGEEQAEEGIPATAEVADGPTRAVVAAVAVALASALERPRRLRRITASSEGVGGNVWALAGRQALMASRVLHRRQR